MKKALVQSRALEALEDQDAFAGMKKTPQEFKKRLQMVDERIKGYERITQNNPSDEESQEKLQTLYMLKSTLTAMQSKIIE